MIFALTHIKSCHWFHASSILCRGYYRCSTSKGCSAKKQVERCRTDASVLIITYTSTHNHTGPDLHNTNLNQQLKESQTESTYEPHPTTPKQEQQEEDNQNENHPIVAISSKDDNEGHNFHYLQSSINCSDDIMVNQEDPFTQNPAEKTDDTLTILLDEEPISCPRMMTFATPKSEENDFFDELEELPTYSAFTSFMRGNFYDERIPVVPS